MQDVSDMGLDGMIVTEAGVTCIVCYPGRGRCRARSQIGQILAPALLLLRFLLPLLIAHTVTHTTTHT